MIHNFFTSESVSEGHPDKIADQISDAILDACLLEDPKSRVACECFISGNKVIIGGEITTLAKIDYEKIARKVLKNIGYNNENLGINYNNCEIEVLIQEQSRDIAIGVDNKGAGDQGIMFGYATNENSSYMPLGTIIAHELVELASKLRKENKFKFALPDMKSQVTMNLNNNNDSKPKIHKVLMSIQHTADYKEKEFKDFIHKNIMQQVARKHKLNEDFEYLINPTGQFIIGGPKSDAGLTGRKIIVDSYGGYARHGGGAFSGKDPTKVDRSAAYMCRYVAKNLVAAGILDKCEIQVSYAIGLEKPQSLNINTFQTEKERNSISLDDIYKLVKECFDFRPSSIIEKLHLQKPIYQITSTYGHFGRKPEGAFFPWEKLDAVDIIRDKLSGFNK